MIEFISTETYEDDAKLTVRVTTDAAYIGKQVEAFKLFLLAMTHHPSNVERVTYEDDGTQGFTRGDGNPEQGDFFDDGVDATDEESGV